MNPVRDGIVTNLLAAGLIEGSAADRRRMQAFLRRDAFSEEIDDLELKFNRSLQCAIGAAGARETDEITGTVDDWDAVVNAVVDGAGSNESDRLVFEDETDAIERITHAIAAVAGYDFEETPQLERELKRTVAKAYRAVVDSFGELEAAFFEKIVAETAIERADLDRLRERLDELEERFTLSLDSEDARAHKHYADLLRDTLDAPEKAKHHYERTLDIDPENARAHGDYARLLHHELGAPEKAEHHYERAFTLAPHTVRANARAHKHYADLLWYEFDDPTEAKHHYEVAFDNDRRYVEAYKHYADLLWHEFDDLEMAKEYYKSALALDPKDAEVHESCTSLLHELDTPLSDNERAIMRDPDSAEAHKYYADHLRYDLYAPEEAQERYERALALNPENATTHKDYAFVLQDLLDAPEMAQEHYEQALSLDPENATTHKDYAHLLQYRLDAPKEAKEHYERALTIDPSLSEVLDSMESL